MVSAEIKTDFTQAVAAIEATLNAMTPSMPEGCMQQAGREIQSLLDRAPTALAQNFPVELLISRIKTEAALGPKIPGRTGIVQNLLFMIAGRLVSMGHGTESLLPALFADFDLSMDGLHCRFNFASKLARAGAPAEVLLSFLEKVQTEHVEDLSRINGRAPILKVLAEQGVPAERLIPLLVNALNESGSTDIVYMLAKQGASLKTLEPFLQQHLFKEVEQSSDKTLTGDREFSSYVVKNKRMVETLLLLAERGETGDLLLQLLSSHSADMKCQKEYIEIAAHLAKNGETDSRLQDFLTKASQELVTQPPSRPEHYDTCIDALDAISANRAKPLLAAINVLKKLDFGAGTRSSFELLKRRMPGPIKPAQPS